MGTQLRISGGHQGINCDEPITSRKLLRLLVGLNAVASVNQLSSGHAGVPDIERHRRQLGTKHIGHVGCVGVEQPIVEGGLISSEGPGKVLVAAVSSS